MSEYLPQSSPWRERLQSGLHDFLAVEWHRGFTHRFSWKAHFRSSSRSDGERALLVTQAVQYYFEPFSRRLGLQLCTPPGVGPFDIARQKTKESSTSNGFGVREGTLRSSSDLLRGKDLVPLPSIRSRLGASRRRLVG